mmetsp:Transcript_10839/g.31066  ORF Transcript_10839/g.31066 Transcript_10839/m.31066 type:complete len:710 (+) Transcript_10839:1209-3338(+)
MRPLFLALILVFVLYFLNETQHVSGRPRRRSARVVSCTNVEDPNHAAFVCILKNEAHPCDETNSQDGTHNYDHRHHHHRKQNQKHRDVAVGMALGDGIGPPRRHLPTSSMMTMEDSRKHADAEQKMTMMAGEKDGATNMLILEPTPLDPSRSIQVVPEISMSCSCRYHSTGSSGIILGGRNRKTAAASTRRMRTDFRQQHDGATLHSSSSSCCSFLADPILQDFADFVTGYDHRRVSSRESNRDSTYNGTTNGNGNCATSTSNVATIADADSSTISATTTARSQPVTAWIRNFHHVRHLDAASTAEHQALPSTASNTTNIAKTNPTSSGGHHGLTMEPGPQQIMVQRSTANIGAATARWWQAKHGFSSTENDGTTPERRNDWKNYFHQHGEDPHHVSSSLPSFAPRTPSFLTYSQITSSSAQTASRQLEMMKYVPPSTSSLPVSESPLSFPSLPITSGNDGAAGEMSTITSSHENGFPPSVMCNASVASLRQQSASSSLPSSRPSASHVVSLRKNRRGTDPNGASSINATKTTTSTKKRKKKSAKSVNRTFGAVQTKRWEEKYTQLCDFIAQHGHANVPLEYKENPSLAHWVKRQRSQYKCLKMNQPSSMTIERIGKLEAVGFVWDSHKSSWTERWHQLKAFFEQHGHSQVPSNHPENPALSVWIKCQRRQMRLRNVGEPSNMSEERIAKLNELNFVWKPRAVESLNMR